MTGYMLSFSYVVTGRDCWLQLLILKYWYIPHLGINHISSWNQLPNLFKSALFISNWSSYLINLVPDHCWEKGLCQNQVVFFLNKAVIIFFVNKISLIKSDVIFLFNSIPEKKKYKSWQCWIYFYFRNCPRLQCLLFSTNLSAFFRESQSIWSIPSSWIMRVYVTTL